MKPPAPRRPARPAAPPVPPAESTPRDTATAARSTRRFSRSADDEASRQAEPTGSAPRDLGRPVGQTDAASILGPSKNASATSIEERRRERKRARLTFYIRAALAGLGGAILVGAAIWAVFFSALFALDSSRVIVEGNEEETLSSAQVLTSITPYEGVPLPRIPTSRIEESIESNLVVDDAEVTRSWPAGLRVSITLRTAVMAEKAANGYSLVDANAVAFQAVADVPSGLPLVSLTEGENRLDAATDAMTVWSSLSESMKSHVASIDANGSTVTLSLTNGASAAWGTPDENELKSQVLEVLVSQRAASRYDVSSPAHPVTS